MRKLMRSIARFNMKKAGAVQINKRGGDGRSKFAKYWRAYLPTPCPKHGLNRRGVKANA